MRARVCASALTLQYVLATRPTIRASADSTHTHTLTPIYVCRPRGRVCVCVHRCSLRHTHKRGICVIFSTFQQSASRGPTTSSSAGARDCMAPYFCARACGNHRGLPASSWRALDAKSVPDIASERESAIATGAKRITLMLLLRFIRIIVVPSIWSSRIISGHWRAD